VLTNNREKEAESGAGYLDCFKGVDRRRTEITCMVWIIQTLCGSTFMGFSTYFCTPPWTTYALLDTESTC
jgi:SP family general alpha glucoside:H+ symporter-like MFS transporter